MTTCCRVTIFEGPDGGGKSTAARKYADKTGARLVHCGPFLGQTSKGLGRSYIEAMLPALLGYQDVVLDRCWISEPIYGRVYRGVDRLGISGRRILERIALRCDARVVLCLPKEEVCVANWATRNKSGGEYVTQESQFRAVYRRYSNDFLQLTELPCAKYDYQNPLGSAGCISGIGLSINGHHNRLLPSVGSLEAKVILVGDEETKHTDYDAFQLYPFCHLGPSGCSRWLTIQLHRAGIRETSICWTSMRDAGARLLIDTWVNERERTNRRRPIIALGKVIVPTWLEEMGFVVTEVVEHPQRWKCFHTTRPYPLINLLKEILL